MRKYLYVLLGLVLGYGLIAFGLLSAQAPSTEIHIPAGVYESEDGVKLYVGVDVPTPTPDTTVEPPTPVPQVCDINLLVLLPAYANHDSSSTLVGSLAPGWYEAERFYYTLTLTEWIKVKGSGWIVGGSNVEYDIDSYCVEIPTDYEQPPPPSPTPSNTPEPQDTPVPSPTPLVTVTLTNTLGNINIRSGPDTSYAKVGLWSLGDTQPVLKFEKNAAGLVWAQIFPGMWTAIGTPGGWWVSSTTGFDTLPGWDTAWPAIPITTAWPFEGSLAGVHISAPVSNQTLQEIINLPNLKIVKAITLAGGNLADVKRARGNDVLTIYRVTDPETPSRDEVYNNHILYADRLRTAWAHWMPDRSVVDYWEIMNEPQNLSGVEDYTALAYFAIDVADYLNRELGVCILLGSFGPGWPLSLAEFVALNPFFQWALEHPCGMWWNGSPKYHGYASHASTYTPFPTPQYPYNNNPWIAGRHLINNQALIDATGFDLLHSPLPVMHTEVGDTYGSDEDNDAFTCEEHRAILWHTTGRYAEEGVEVLAWWNVCGGDNCWGWRNDSRCLTIMFG